MSDLLLALYLQIPLVFSGVLHMVAVTYNWFPTLRIALHTPYFGANKTWRGFIFMPLFTVLGIMVLWLSESLIHVPLLAQKNMFTGGILLGLGYVLAELPNSFLKRRLGIAAGKHPEHHKQWFIFLDQFDSGFGVALVYWLYFNVPLPICLLYIVTFPVTALLVKKGLFLAGLKKTSV